MSILKTYDVFRTEAAVANRLNAPTSAISMRATIRHLQNNQRQIEEMFTGYFLVWMNGEEIPNCIGFEYVRPDSSGVRSI